MVLKADWNVSAKVLFNFMYVSGLVYPIFTRRLWVAGKAGVKPSSPAIIHHKKLAFERGKGVLIRLCKTHILFGCS